MLLADRIIEIGIKDFGFVEDGSVNRISNKIEMSPWQPFLNFATSPEIPSIYFRRQEENSFIPKSILKTTNESSMKVRKSISFHPKVKVILIPRRSELRPIFKYLYYSYEELEMSKIDALRELHAYRFSTNCLEKRDLLVNIGVFVDGGSTVPIVPTETDEVGDNDTDSDSSNKILLPTSNTPNTSTESPNNSDCLDVVLESLPDQTFRYPVNLRKFHKNECSVKVASIILYQPFTSFVSDMIDN